MHFLRPRIAVTPLRNSMLISNESVSGVKIKQISLKHVRRQRFGARKANTRRRRTKDYGRGDGRTTIRVDPWARSNDLRVSRELIMVKTKCLDDKTCDKSEKDVFIARNGWLQKNFLQK